MKKSKKVEYNSIMLGILIGTIFLKSHFKPPIMKRIIDFSDTTSSLHIQNQQLIIELVDGETHSIPVDEIAAVIFSSYRLNLTKSVLELLAQCGAIAIICDERKMPVGMALPIEGHHLQSRFVKEQASVSLPTQKRLWKQIVCAKIRAQSQNLNCIHKSDAALGRLEKEVKSGDETNIEGRAARKYWSALFRGEKFSRNSDAQDKINSSLNYGYAVLRGIVARSVVASGLNPSLGLFHHNKYNAFCLADDLMEPFRPVVDNSVWKLWQQNALDEGITTPVKKALIGAITGRYVIDNRQETIFEAATRATASLTAVFCGQGNKLCLPEKLPFMIKAKSKVED